MNGSAQVLQAKARENARQQSIAHSTWTPLSDADQNTQVYDERRHLVMKWWQHWSSKQRVHFIRTLLSNCSYAEAISLSRKIHLPVMETDFTAILPRYLTIYVLSFLDPRTLSRCAAVCHRWKVLSEADELWATRCLKLGWNLPFTPSPFEQGVWKRNYTENVKYIQSGRFKRESEERNQESKYQNPVSTDVTWREQRRGSEMSLSLLNELATPRTDRSTARTNFVAKNAKRPSSARRPGSSRNTTARSGSFSSINNPKPSSGRPVVSKPSNDTQTLSEFPGNRRPPSGANTMSASASFVNKVPWKSSAPYPQDIWRINYLETADFREKQAKKALRQKKRRERAAGHPEELLVREENAKENNGDDGILL